ncbi:MAG: protein-methionine-sulfoxide reductase heme-binding subunit MsrQ [Roseovarius sp.]|nr:protein-methionine-sulfoxide reductase heme-binding subunit MsrQ [Roseovarius sp.]
MCDRINSLARRVPVWAVWLGIGWMAPWLVWQGATGGLGAEPIKALEQKLGKIALQLLVLGLCLSPLRRYLGVNLLRFRRAIGLLAFCYVCLHLAVWLFLDLRDAGRIWADIVKRPYVTVGMTAFALMIPLAATSNNRSVRWLGPRWRMVHRLTYAVAVLGAVHFIWLSKGFRIEPLAWLAVILVLLALRWRSMPRQRSA